MAGVKARIEGNIGRVYAGVAHPYIHAPAPLFTREKGKPSLYDLRNTVAHGSTDTLSESEREYLRDRAPEVEIIARQYIMLVLQKATGLIPLLDAVLGSVTMNFLNGVSSHAGMYRGSTHLAALYMGAGPHPTIFLPATDQGS